VKIIKHICIANDKSSQKPFPQNWIKLNKPKLVKIKAKAKVKTVKINAITKELGMNFWEKEVREEDKDEINRIWLSNFFVTPYFT